MQARFGVDEALLGRFVPMNGLAEDPSIPIAALRRGVGLAPRRQRPHQFQDLGPGLLRGIRPTRPVRRRDALGHRYRRFPGGALPPFAPALAVQFGTCPGRGAFVARRPCAGQCAAHSRGAFRRRHHPPAHDAKPAGCRADHRPVAEIADLLAYRAGQPATPAGTRRAGARARRRCGHSPG